MTYEHPFVLIDCLNTKFVLSIIFFPHLGGFPMLPAVDKSNTIFPQSYTPSPESVEDCKLDCIAAGWSAYDKGLHAHAIFVLGVDYSCDVAAAWPCRVRVVGSSAILY